MASPTPLKHMLIDLVVASDSGTQAEKAAAADAFVAGVRTGQAGEPNLKAIVKRHDARNA
jgi:hypothetical protein